MKYFHDGIIGLKSLFSPSQNAHVPGFDTETCPIGGHIGSRLVDHTHHSQRHPLFTNKQSIRPFLHLLDLPNGIVQLHNFPETPGNTRYPLARQGQPVQNGPLQTHLFAHLQVLHICLQNSVRVFLEQIGYERQDLIFLFCV